MGETSGEDLGVGCKLVIVDLIFVQAFLSKHFCRDQSDMVSSRSGRVGATCSVL